MNPPAGAKDEAAVGRILIVEDERSLALGLLDALAHAGYSGKVAGDGRTALDLLLAEEFDLVVLDLMLPELTGFELLRRLREAEVRVRVLILTAVADEDTLLEAFQLGADDYLTKPFSAKELVARIAAQFRRRELDATPPTALRLPDGSELDFERGEVRRGGTAATLTVRETQVLEHLVLRAGRVVSRDELVDALWGDGDRSVDRRAVDIHVVGLRRKVEVDPTQPRWILTVRGRGYCWAL